MGHALYPVLSPASQDWVDSTWATRAEMDVDSPAVEEIG